MYEYRPYISLVSVLEIRQQNNNRVVFSDLDRRLYR